MPGLVGIISNKGSNDRLLDKMTNSMRHEDWHKVDKYTSPFFSVARISLGIFNPEPQPIFNEDKTICIFIYGKIYGYEGKLNELKNRGHRFTSGNDAEFCLHSYEEYGKDFVRSLNGSFALAIYELERKRVMIANDRYGTRPIYYAIINNKLIFASEVKALLEDSEFNKELNDNTIADFFTFGEILGDKTFFKGIEVLPPASLFTYGGAKISIERYWDFNYEPDYALSEEELVDLLVNALTKAVRIRMNDNLRYGVALSGGLDSRTVLAAVDKKQRQSLTAFTFGVPVCNEIKVAREVARKARVNHLVIELDAGALVPYAEKVICLSDGMDWLTAAFIPYAFARAKEVVDVFCFGLALDLTLGGSFITHNMLTPKSSEETLKILYRKTAISSTKLLATLFTKDYYSKIKDMPPNSLAESFYGAKGEHPMNKSDYFFLRNHVRRLTALGSVIARNMVEEAIPTFDNDFIEVILKIPPALRYKYRIYRKFLIRLAPELAAIPYSRTMVRADSSLLTWEMGRIYQGGKERIKKKICRLTRNKIYLPNNRGYLNFSEWLRLNESWRMFIRKLLIDDNANCMEYFNRACIKRLIQEHESGRIDHSRIISYLATFELFLQMFVTKQLQKKL